MKHRVNYRKLGRKTSHRIAMLRNMTTSLIEHERIRTTVTRAKEVRRFADHMVTLAKKGNGDSAAYQRAAVTVQTKEAMDKLFDVLANRSRDRNGGYTRIMRCGYRDGDKAPMCYIEYIDREGELRMCKKVGGEVVSESTTPSTEVQEKSAAETIDEEIQKIVQKPSLEGIPEVSLSEEKTRKNSMYCYKHVGKGKTTLNTLIERTVGHPSSYAYH
ncbi:ribosomal protein L17 [Blastocystis sp. subtype 4]|uniref:ribosomal protein L17 n=1 Tax=Blastocystis sp. subtype 4 TaxID=944170 RepID=UPI00071198E9|nr:ribosomal protein L17 [Blastocystis sp. subtype 4]KNB41897.1 ribosomal protein L17 [Blastocystis sp. subtype 4]|eukprot:XP_014525340.1 ribosomal protein L17 [Blastocystis sp. subtype 4]